MALQHVTEGYRRYGVDFLRPVPSQLGIWGKYDVTVRIFLHLFQANQEYGENMMLLFVFFFTCSKPIRHMGEYYVVSVHIFLDLTATTGSATCLITFFFQMKSSTHSYSWTDLNSLKKRAEPLSFAKRNERSNHFATKALKRGK